MSKLERKLIVVGIITVALIILSNGCGSSKKDTTIRTSTGTSTWSYTNTGTTDTGTGTGPTGSSTGTGTTSTGTGTGPTGSSTGTGTTGTGTSPTGALPGTVTCCSGYYASGWYDVEINQHYDGDINMSYQPVSGNPNVMYECVKWGWAKFDFSGIPTTARISGARLMYYAIESNWTNNYYYDDGFSRFSIEISTSDPQSGTWNGLPSLYYYYGTQRINYTSTMYWYNDGWFPEDTRTTNSLRSDILNRMNDAIADGQGFVTLKIVGC